MTSSKRFTQRKGMV